jgi:7-methyl-GTP pyrophosphatase
VRSIVLASSSPYRRELLSRLGVPFDIDRPDVEESARPAEPPAATALRLAHAKAAAIVARRPDALVIGSDQVADLAGVAIGKPGSFGAALDQLLSMQGRTVVFHTAIALVDGADGHVEVANVPTTVLFRSLPRATLEAYLRLDKPFDCAGAAKIEAAGIALVQSVESTDPTALIGLPLIRLTTMLASRGVAVPPA